MIYRKLKDYILVEEHNVTSIFGTLMNSECIYNYFDKKQDKFINWSCGRTYTHEMDFLLEYYVIGLFPIYILENNTIIPKIRVCLKENID